MRRLPAGVWLVIALPLALLRCGGGALPGAEAADADGIDGLADADVQGGDAIGDAGICPRRGRRVEGVAPVDVHREMRVLTTERTLYMAAAPCRSAGVSNMQVARVSLGPAVGPLEFLCMGDVFQQAFADGMAYSPESGELALGGAGVLPQAVLAVVSVLDPGWSPRDGSPAQGAAVERFPEGDGGATGGRVPSVIFMAGRPLFVSQSEGRGATVSARRVAPRTLELDVRSEPRVLRFEAVAAASNGGAWAAGITPDRHAALLKLTSSNKIDTGTAGGGYFRLPSTAATPYVLTVGLGVDARGRVHALVHDRDARSLVLRRFGADGMTDTGFGTAGSLAIPLEAAVSSERVPMVVEGSGAVIVGGLVPNAAGKPLHSAFVRVLSDGALDPVFGGDGPFLMEPSSDPTADLDPGGVVLVAAAAGTCEGEFLASFGQKGSRKAYLFH